MKLANCAFVVAIALAMGSGSAAAEEQTVPSKSAPQPTVMSDAQLDQIVGGISVMNRLVDTWSEHDVWSAGDGAAWAHLQNVLFVVPTE